MSRRELPELQDRSLEVQELMNRIPSRTVRWGLGIIFGLVAAFLVASCFIRCPEYLKVESRLDYNYTDSLGIRIVGVAYIEKQDMEKIEVGMPIYYHFPKGKFEGCVQDLTPKYDPLIRMSGVKLYFEPDVKIHPIYVGGYGLPGKLLIANPTLFDCIFRPKKAKRVTDIR